jgi:hypothetical protein
MKKMPKVTAETTSSMATTLTSRRMKYTSIAVDPAGRRPEPL